MSASILRHATTLRVWMSQPMLHATDAVSGPDESASDVVRTSIRRKIQQCRQSQALLMTAHVTSQLRVALSATCRAVP